MKSVASGSEAAKGFYGYLTVEHPATGETPLHQFVTDTGAVVMEAEILRT